MTDGPGLRERKKRETRAALVRAAVRLCGERGFDAVTVADVAEVAGVSQRTFFNYFSGKDEAVTAPTDPPEVHAAEVRARAAEIAAGASVLEVTLGVLAGEVEALDRDAEQVRLRLAVITQKPELIGRLVASGAATEAMFTEVVVERVGPEHAAAARAVVPAALTMLSRAVLEWQGDPATPLGPVFEHKIADLRQALAG